MYKQVHFLLDGNTVPGTAVLYGVHYCTVYGGSHLGWNTEVGATSVTYWYPLDRHAAAMIQYDLEGHASSHDANTSWSV